MLVRALPLLCLAACSSSAPAPKPTLHVGQLSRAKGADMEWVACDGSTRHSLSGTPETLAEVQKLLRAHAQAMDPEAPTASASFAFLGRVDEGAARIDSWQMLGVFDCAPIAPDALWKLHGTEPFWALSIDQDGATFSEMGVDAETRFAAPVVNTENGRTLAMLTESSSAAKTRAEIVAEPCSDGMADITYAYSVAVNGPDRSLRGCGIRARPGPTSP